MQRVSVLHRIEQSPLAVIRTGLIEANYGALASEHTLSPDEAARLLELLLGQLITSSDENLRRVSCGLLACRLCMPSTEALADLPTILRHLELHLRSSVPPGDLLVTVLVCFASRQQCSVRCVLGPRQLGDEKRLVKSSAVKKDLVKILDFLVRDERDSHKWLEALVCSPSLLECVALDISLSPIHLAMSRQLSNYSSLRSLQLTRDSFFR